MYSSFCCYLLLLYVDFCGFMLDFLSCKNAHITINWCKYCTYANLNGFISSDYVEEGESVLSSFVGSSLFLATSSFPSILLGIFSLSLSLDTKFTTMLTLCYLHFPFCFSFLSFFKAFLTIHISMVLSFVV